jgi:hypothetical protein
MRGQPGRMLQMPLTRVFTGLGIGTGSDKASVFGVTCIEMIRKKKTEYMMNFMINLLWEHEVSTMRDGMQICSFYKLRNLDEAAVLCSCSADL